MSKIIRLNNATKIIRQGGTVRVDDDVLFYADLAAFPATGELGKVYVAEDTNLIYRWDGADYTQIGGSGADPNAVKFTPQSLTAPERAIAQTNIGIDLRLQGEVTVGYGVNNDYRIHSSAYPNIETALNEAFANEVKGTKIIVTSDNNIATTYQSQNTARVLTRPGYFLEAQNGVTFLNADSPQYDFVQVTVANEAARGTAANTMYYATAEETFTYWDGSQYRAPTNPVFFDDDSNFFSVDDLDFLVLSNLKIEGNADASVAFGQVGNRQYNVGGAGGSSISIANSHMYFLNCNLKNAVRYNSFIGAGSFGNSLTGTFNFTKNSKYVTITGGAALSELSEGDTLRDDTNGNVAFPVARIISNTAIELKYPWVYDNVSSTVKKNRRIRLIEINSIWGKTLRDDTHGGGPYRDSYVENCIYENAGGYGIGSTNWIDSYILNSVCRSNVNGGGFERGAGNKIIGCQFYNNQSKGLQLINGSHDNTVRDCDAYGNDDGFQDANFSTERGQNTGNRYYNCRAFMNNQHGARIVGLKDGYCNFISYNNFQNRDGTLSLGAGVAATGTSEYNTEDTVFECETFDDQNTPTQSTGLYLDSKCDRCTFDLAKVDSVQYPTLDYPQRCLYLNAPEFVTGAGTTRELLPHQVNVAIPNVTLEIELARAANYMSGQQVQLKLTSGTLQTLTVKKNDGDGTASTLGPYPSYMPIRGRQTWEFQEGFGAGNMWNCVRYPYPYANLQDFADDTAAAAGGVVVGQAYRTGSIIKIRIS